MSGHAARPSRASAAAFPPRASVARRLQRRLARQDRSVPGLRLDHDPCVATRPVTPRRELFRKRHGRPHRVVSAGDEQDVRLALLERNRGGRSSFREGSQALLVERAVRNRPLLVGLPGLVIRDERKRCAPPRPRRAIRVRAAVEARPDVRPRDRGRRDRDDGSDARVTTGEEQRALGALRDRDDTDPAGPLVFEPVGRRAERLQRHLADPGRLALSAEPAQRHGKRAVAREEARSVDVDAPARATQDDHADTAFSDRTDRCSLQAALEGLLARGVRSCVHASGRPRSESAAAAASGGPTGSGRRRARP